MCEDMTANNRPYHTARAERLRELCRLLGLDAILLITGWDGCYNLGSKRLVEWLCETPGAQPADMQDALEEGLFVVTPDDVEWFIAHETDVPTQAPLQPAVAAEAVVQPPRDCCGCSNSTPQPMQVSPAHSFEQQPTFYHNHQQHHQRTLQPCSLNSDPGDSCSRLQEQQQQLSTAYPAGAAANNTAAVQQGVHIDGKLSLLLQLQPNLRRVGVPLGIEVLNGLQQRVDASSILKWPLLMALAETVGVQMDDLFQDIMDISHELPRFQGVVDGTMLFHVLRMRRPQLHRSWLEAMSGCWKRSTGPKLDLSEAAMAAPLTEFVSGCGCRLNLGQYQPLALPPRVLFGPRTSQTGALSSDSITLRSVSNQQGYAVLHATAEAADACCGLRFARTVFFSQGTDRPHHSPQQQQLTSACQSQSAGQALGQTMVDYEVDQQDLFDLLSWYEAVVDGAWAGMKHFATEANATWESMHACIASTVTAAAMAAGLPAPSITPAGGDSLALQQQQQQQQPQLTVQLLSWDGGPRPMPVYHSLEQYNMRFKTLRVMCSNIRSRSAAHRGALLGSVLYSDTFLEVPAMGNQPAQLVNLTITHCPLYTFNFWGAESAENNTLVAAFRRHLQLQLQAQLTAQAQAQLQAHIQAQWTAQAQQQQQQQEVRRRSVDNPVGVSQNPAAVQAGAAAAAAGAGSPPSPVTLAAAAATAPSAAALGLQRASLPLPQQQQHMLLMQQQQQLQQQQVLTAAAAKRGQRRLSTPEQQQMLLLQQQQTLQAQALLQQYASGAASSQQQQQQQAAAARKQQAAFHQQLLMQLQVSNTKQQQHSGKHGLAGPTGSDSLGQVAAVDGGISSKATKRSCCGPNSSSSPVPGAAAPGSAVWGNSLGTPNGHNTPHLAAAGAAVSPSIRRSTTPPVLSVSPPAGSAAAAGTAGALAPNTLYKSRSLDGAAAAAAQAVAAAQVSGVFDPAVLLQRLGQLLVPAGEMPGEIGLVFTGANKLAVMDGPLYPHQGGLAFVSRPSKVHVLLLEQVESVWLQDLGNQLPGYAAVGPCMVLKGRKPACGLLPATHLTDNPHIVIPLRAMSKACREHWVTAVLPAWQASTGIVTNSRGASASWPVPVELQPAYRYWLQGPRKRYIVVQPDEVMELLLLAMDMPRQQQQQQQQHQQHQQEAPELVEASAAASQL